MEDDEHADMLGVINALERTCELEAKLRQAVQDTHPLTTTLDWDFSAADKEREALLAISEQLEFLEDKLREYRKLEAHEEENKMDNVRRELVEVIQQSAPYISFGKDAVREVMQFATLSDGGPDDQGGGGDMRSPSPAQGAGGRSAGGHYYRPTGGGSREGASAGYRQGVSNENGERARAFAALMSPNKRRDAGSPAGSPSTGLFSPGGASKSVDPRSNASSPYGQQQPLQQQQQQHQQRGERGYERDGSRGGMWREEGGGAAGGRAAAAGRVAVPRLPPQSRRQINLDLAAVNAAARGAASGSAGVRGSDRIPGATERPSQQQQQYYGNGGGSAASSARRDYTAAARPSSGGGGTGSAANSARQYAAGGGSNVGGGSRPSSARGVHSARAGSEVGGRILSRLDPPAPYQRSASPASLRAEDIYGAANGAGSGSGNSRPGSSQHDSYGGMLRLRDMYGMSAGGSTAASAGVGGQQDFGGMVRIRDMLDRAEKDLTAVQEEREQRRSPVPARIFGGSAQGSRFDDADSRGSPVAAVATIKEGGTGYSPPQPRQHKPSIVGPSATPGANDSAYHFQTPPAGPAEDGRRVAKAAGSRATSGGAYAAAAASSGTSWGARAGRGEAAPRPGSGGVGAALGWLVKRLVAVAAVGAVAAAGVAAVDAAAKWVRSRPPRPAKDSKPTRDLPPWLIPSLQPPPGAPQRSKLGRPPGAGSPPPRPKLPQQTGWAPGPVQLPQSPVVHVLPLPEGDLFPSMPPPDVNVAKG